MFQRCIIQLKNSINVRLESDIVRSSVECYHSRTHDVGQVVLRAKQLLYLLKLSRNVNHISFCTPVSGENYCKLDKKRDDHYRAVIAQCEPYFKITNKRDNKIITKLTNPKKERN